MLYIYPVHVYLSQLGLVAESDGAPDEPVLRGKAPGEVFSPASRHDLHAQGLRLDILALPFHYSQRKADTISREVLGGGGGGLGGTCGGGGTIDAAFVSWRCCF